MKKIKTPNIKEIIKQGPPSLKPPYGVYLIADEIDETDGETGLIVNFDKNPVFKTSNSKSITGVVIAVADNFISKYTGDYIPKIGDRIISITNKVIPITLDDNNGVKYKLLLVNESDIIGVADSDTQLGA